MGEKKRRHAADGSWGKGLASYKVTGVDSQDLGGDPEMQALAAGIIQEVLNSADLHRPVYRPDIKSEAQTTTTPLPLAYVWNEDRTRGSFTVSINGRIVGRLLEERLPRSDPRFTMVRDYLISMLGKVINGSVVDSCTHFRAMPSALFSLGPDEAGPETA